jgi:hypothetical protein
MAGSSRRLGAFLISALLFGMVVAADAHAASPTPATAEASAAQTVSCRIKTIQKVKIVCDGGSAAAKPDNAIFYKASAEADDLAALAAMKPGDWVQAPAQGPVLISDISIMTAHGSALRITLALGVGVAFTLAFAMIVSAGASVPGLWRGFALLIGQNGRFSNSKTQAVLWAAALLITYAGTCTLRLMAGMGWQNAINVDIPQNLLTIATVSVGAVGGAKIVSATKAGMVAATNLGAPSWKDFFYADGLVANARGDWDPGDTQMIVVTIASIILFATRAAALWGDMPMTAHVALPEPASAMTFAFGGAMGGYLAKKIGSGLGQG